MPLKKFPPEHTDEWVDCLGDLVAGDYVRFKKAIFIGKYPKASFSHYETIEGLILKESYGAEKQQHTFTILKNDNTKMLIKGRNLYKECERLIWVDEDARDIARQEKHIRGEEARRKREERLEEKRKQDELREELRWEQRIRDIYGDDIDTYGDVF